MFLIEVDYGNNIVRTQGARVVYTRASRLLAFRFDENKQSELVMNDPRAWAYLDRATGSKRLSARKVTCTWMKPGETNQRVATADRPGGA